MPEPLTADARFFFLLDLGDDVATFEDAERPLLVEERCWLFFEAEPMLFERVLAFFDEPWENKRNDEMLQR